jgi:aspartate ammonia-lyase
VTFAAEAGQLQLNAFEPVICWSLYEAATLLTRAMDMLRENCVVGIEADVEACRAHLESSTALATELVPLIGYARAAAVATHAQRHGNLLDAIETLEPGLGAEIIKSNLEPAHERNCNID